MENVELFLSEKSQFDLVEKIKNENKYRTRASLLNLQRTGNKKFFYVAIYRFYDRGGFGAKSRQAS